MNNLVLGSVVESRSGRDSGSYYIVVKIIDREYVMIADGEIRKIEKPKKKKYKHLKPNGDILSKIAKKLSGNEVIYNAEIRSALRKYNQKENTEV
jgi:ribosomal protein L14E/L6E/L27E